jgi:hypothetical protein
LRSLTVYTFAAVIVFCLLIACRKNIPIPETQTTPADLTAVFDAFWTGMNDNYVYWDMDPTDWASIRHIYRPLFQQLDIHSDEDIRRSMNYFREMTKDLVDGHFYCRFTPAAIRDSILYPAADRKKKQPDFHGPYPYLSVAYRYLDPGAITGIDTITDGPENPIQAITGTIDRNVLYFTCNKFSLFRSFYSNRPSGVRDALNHFFNELNAPGLKEVILDVRENPGGDLADLDFLAGCFITTVVQFAWSRYRNGLQPLDYTPWISAYIHPQAAGRSLSVPIVILADNYSASLSETMIMAIHSLPNGKFVGERTWGATGALREHDLYNAGSFDVTGFMSVRISSAATKFTDEKVYEGVGFPPDISAPFHSTAFSAGRDEALEAALVIVH